MDIPSAYNPALTAMAAMAVLLLLQILTVDILGIRAGHAPGSSVQADHSNPLFRATRTVANSNESIAVFILALVFCVLSGASPQYTGYAAWAYVASRTLYALCYYCNLQLLRSVIFGVSLLALAFLIGVGILT